MFATVKLIHILSATLLFGTGLGSAFYMYFTYRTGDPQAIKVTTRLVVWADFLFTTPAIIIQLVTGLYMANLLAMPTPWLTWVLSLFLLVGACWIPVVFIQIHLHKLTKQAPQPSPAFHYWMKIWFTLGVAAFLMIMALFYLMVMPATKVII